MENEDDTPAQSTCLERTERRNNEVDRWQWRSVHRSRGRRGMARATEEHMQWEMEGPCEVIECARTPLVDRVSARSKDDSSCGVQFEACGGAATEREVVDLLCGMGFIDAAAKAAVRATSQRPSNCHAPSAFAQGSILQRPRDEHGIQSQLDAAVEWLSEQARVAATSSLRPNAASFASDA